MSALNLIIARGFGPEVQQLGTLMGDEKSRAIDARQGQAINQANLANAQQDQQFQVEDRALDAQARQAAGEQSAQLQALYKRAQELSALPPDDPQVQQGWREVVVGMESLKQGSGKGISEILNPKPQAPGKPVIVQGPNGPVYADPKSAIGQQAFIRQPASTNINVGTPKPPTGYLWNDPSDPSAGVAPIQGGPKDNAKKEGMKESLVLSTIDNTMAEIDEAIQSAGLITTGPVGWATKAIPGTPAYDLANTVLTIKANIGFDRLQAMRDASPTGGALGQVAVQELNALQASIASLDINQSPNKVRSNLAKVKRHYEKWRGTIEQAGKPESGGAPKVGDVDGGFRFKGGDPADPQNWVKAK